MSCFNNTKRTDIKKKKRKIYHTVKTSVDWRNNYHPCRGEKRIEENATCYRCRFATIPGLILPRDKTRY